MKDLLLSLVLLAFLKMLFEEARIRSWLIRGLHTLLYSGVIVFSHFRAQYLSLPRIEAVFYTPEVLSDIALFVMLDLLLVFFVAITYARKDDPTESIVKGIPWGTSRQEELPSRKDTPRYRAVSLGRKIILGLPSLLFLPVLFYVRLMLFYAFPGESFETITAIFVAVVAFCTLFAPSIAHLFVDVRGRNRLSQVSITASFLSFLLVVGAGVLHPESRIAQSYTAIQDWKSVVAMGALLLAGILSGWLLFRINVRRECRKLSKKNNP